MYLGIDTSCYTTSLAAVDSEGRLLADERRLLPVPEGKRGLRQSEAVFLHLGNLPELAALVKEKLGMPEIAGIAASVRPRPLEQSYMPVFTVGASFGKSLASFSGAAFWELSHQEGHLLAGIWSSGMAEKDFYALHVSGGTTELLAVVFAGGIWKIKKIGGTEDLHAGQFIDRAGVALGLSFPAGPELEKLAQKAGSETVDVPVSVRGTTVSFSGPESHIQRLISAAGGSRAEIARAVESCIAASLLRLVRNAWKEYGQKPVLFIGGVMANDFIRRRLDGSLPGYCLFADARYSGDNAVGAALYAREKAKADAS